MTTPGDTAGQIQNGPFFDELLLLGEVGGWILLSREDLRTALLRSHSSAKSTATNFLRTSARAKRAGCATRAYTLFLAGNARALTRAEGVAQIGPFPLQSKP